MHTLARFSLNHLINTKVKVLHAHGCAIGILKTEWDGYFHLEMMTEQMFHFTQNNIYAIHGSEIHIGM